MDIKEKAKLFAIKAHKGQVRKSESDKPMVLHPIDVGLILEEFGYDDNVIAAGFLHDVVEDTKYTIDDIKREFGEDIAQLVFDASEEDKSLSWEERKKKTIEKTRTLPLRNRLIICADKISNLEDLNILFAKNGIRDFSAFKRGEESQKWYYTELYKSLVFGEDENSPIFKRLKKELDTFLGIGTDLLQSEIFSDDLDYYKELKRLHAEKYELIKLKRICSVVRPFIIEFTGTPRTGKTTTINNLYDFFKKAGFDISIIEEFTTSKRFKSLYKSVYSKMDMAHRNLTIADEVLEELERESLSSHDIILLDRSVNDRQIWNYRRFISGEMTEEEYFPSKEKLLSASKRLIDFLVITYASPEVSLKRDYLSSLALEKRSFLNIKNISEYNDALTHLEDQFVKSNGYVCKIDTSSMPLRDVSVRVASEVMPQIRKRYIKSFRDFYK